MTFSFSRTLTEHLQHLKLVIGRLLEAGLKLQPSKCHFVRKEVVYLGHIITPDGLKPNPRLVSAVKEFPVPRDVRQVRQFLGLSSYYRRFIAQFAKVAKPLHELTRKGVEFAWSPDFQAAFDMLRGKLSQAPVLSYPSFDREYSVQASATGLSTDTALVFPSHNSSLLNLT